MGPSTFEIAGIDSVVSNLRICHRDNLSAIARVSENLLITGHAGVEYDFSGRDARCAEWKTFVDSAVA